MKTKKMNLDPGNKVVMSNDLIKSKSDLSLNETKLLRIAIMQVLKEDKDLKTYTVSIVDLGQMLGIKSANLYRDIQDICIHLKKEIVLIGDGNPRHKWKIFSWVDSISYEDGTITIKLSEDLKPHLTDLSAWYTMYTLEDVLYLKSVHSIRLYELIRQEMKYQKVYADKTATVYLDLDTIKKATGTESKYDKMSMFRRRVIESSVNEINEKLEYHIEYQMIKKGRRATGFEFKIESKSNYMIRQKE